MNRNEPIKIAILDLYEGHPNQGMRCLREIINQWAEQNHYAIQLSECDVRLKQELPDLNFNIFISSGGPGSPIDSEGTEWEEKYFAWIKSIEDWNANPENYPKKHILFICHSFQLACRYFKVADISKRKSTSFGVFPVHMLQNGEEETVFEGLKDPFYAMDSREYQATNPDHQRIRSLGGKILAIEKERSHVPLERAIMAIRFNDYCIGTQFHPEADAVGMTMYLNRTDKKDMVIESHGERKWHNMIEQLKDPDKIMYTYNHVVPNFLNMAVGELVTF